MAIEKVTAVSPEVADSRWTVRPPAWEETEPLTLAKVVAAFEHTVSFTIGVEEELMLVEPERLDLAPVIDEVLPLVESDARFARELRAAQIEIITPVCLTASDACRELGHAREHLIERLAGRYRLLGCGTHPFSTRHGEITGADRYRQIADEYVWAAKRSLVCGLHVHMAVPGADRALAVFNGLRSYLPELAALAANSPYVDGVDSGMSSVRPSFNGVFPRSGVPPVLESWEEFVRYLNWGRRGGLFPDATHMWWELRPHPRFGTLEVRVADTQTRLEDATAFVAVVQALVTMLSERHDAREEVPVHPTHWIEENAWRAHRYGVRGWLVELESGRRVPTRDRLAALIDLLEPYAERFSAAEQLHGARALLVGNGCDRQRYVHEREGSVGLTRWLASETEQSAIDA